MKNIKEETNRLSAIAYEEIKHCIIKGELEPGERITELKLSETLGTSRTPIREAIRRLGYEGYVNLLPNGGFAVSGVTQNDVLEILEVRCALECEAARMAAVKITEKQKKHLSDILIKHDKILESGTSEESSDFFTQLDMEFHNEILSIADNSRFIDIEDSLHDRLYRQRLAIETTEVKVRECIEQHRNIAEAILRSDVEGAAFYSRYHIMQISALFKELV